MNDNAFLSQPTHTPQHSPPPSPPRQSLPKPAQPGYSALWDIAQHPQQSHVQAPLATAYNPQCTILPPPEQSALYANYNYGLQWQKSPLQYQQHPLPPMVQLPPHSHHLAVQPGYNPYQSTADYQQHYIPHPVVSPQPQLPYDLYLQPQQQQQWKRLDRTTSQHLMPAKQQRLGGPDLDSHFQHHSPLPPQPQSHMRHPTVQADYNPYQSTAGDQHYIPQSMGSSPPQLPYYPHLQLQQHLQHITAQHPMPANRQQLDILNLNKQVRHHCHHVPPPPQPQFKPALPIAQNIREYPSQIQGSGHVDGLRGPNNTQFGVNEEGSIGNRGDMNSGGSGGARGLMSGMASRSQSGSQVGSSGGDGRAGGGIQVGGDFDGAASMQTGGRNQFPNIAELVIDPVARQLEGAQGFTISGNPRFTNIGMNTGTVNNYGATHGLEKLEIFVSFAALYDSSAQDPDRRCHPGTRENVLTRLRYWIDNPNVADRIFWLHGPAGAGKSAIAQTIAHAYDKGEVAATFFLFRSDTGRYDGNRLFPTIAWQLAFSIPATKEFIVHALDKTPHLPTKGIETQFEQLVAHVFQPTNNVASQMLHPAPVVIIDGVDECSDEQLQRRILGVIGNAVKDCGVPLRFLISSRPEALIEDTLNQFQDITLRIDLATLDDSNRDIEKYLVGKFSVIASKQRLAPTWPGQGIIEEIVFKSSGNFILASTLIKFISDEDCSAVSQLDIVRKLKPRGSMSPFALLDELYLEILKRQRDQDFLKTFLALLIGRSSIENTHFRWERDFHKDDAMLMNVSEQELHIKLRRMRSLLQFEPFIDVYHKSFLDFLQDPSRSGQYYVSERYGIKTYLELIGNSFRHVCMAGLPTLTHLRFFSAT